VIARDGYICTYCATPVIESETAGIHRLAIDHRVPVSLGGQNDLQNLVVACHGCNSRKNTRPPSALIDDLSHVCTEECPATTGRLSLQAVAYLLGLTRQRVDQMSRCPGFPEELPERRHGYGKRRTWDEAAVRAWAETNGRLS